MVGPSTQMQPFDASQQLRIQQLQPVPLTARTDNTQDDFDHLLELDHCPVVGTPLPGKPKRSLLQLFKTKLCQAWSTGRCRRGRSCRFAHGDQELRVSPDLSKTKKCPYLSTDMGCQSGPNCPFAHTEAELRVTEGCFKTSLCRFWEADQCINGDACRFAHGAHELRMDTEAEDKTETTRNRSGATSLSTTSSEHDPALRMASQGSFMTRRDSEYTRRDSEIQTFSPGFQNPNNKAAAAAAYYGAPQFQQPYSPAGVAAYPMMNQQQQQMHMNQQMQMNQQQARMINQQHQMMQQQPQQPHMTVQQQQQLARKQSQTMQQAPPPLPAPMMYIDFLSLLIKIRTKIMIFHQNLSKTKCAQ